MSLLEREFLEFDRKGSWAVEYQKIRSEAALNHDFDYRDAKKPENRGRNRYRDVSPYDHSRVKLNQIPNGYINASLVEVPSAGRKYIMTQGPLPTTSGHFWLLVWEQNSRAVVMLNRVVEKGTIKCHQYWPLGDVHGGEEEIYYDDVGIKVTCCGEVSASYFVIRTLEITNVATGETKEVLHFHYTTWPDFGVPSSPGAFLNFLAAIRQSGAFENDVGPCVIHCSAGIGRTGTLALVDSSLVLIENSGDMNSVDVRSLLLEMRQYRMGLIQTPDQLRFSYMAVIEGARQLVTKPLNSGIDSQRQEHEAPPPPPVRTTSRRPPPPDEPPPLPPRRNRTPTETSSPTASPEEKLPNSGSGEVPNNILERPVAADITEPEQDKNRETEVRRRKREEKKLNTQEQIKRMKQKLRESEIYNHRKSFFKPIFIGLSVTVLLGGYLLYRYYT